MASDRDLWCDRTPPVSQVWPVVPVQTLAWARCLGRRLIDACSADLRRVGS